MAMAGRLRSALPLFQRIIRSDSISAVVQRSSVHRSLLCPTFINSEFSKNYATASPPKEQKVKVPLVLYGGTGNYATALYIAAVKANVLEKVESEIFELIESSKASVMFSEFLKDVSIPTKDVQKAIIDICTAAKFSDVTKNFLAVLADYRRLKYLEEIAGRFAELTTAHRGEVKAIVTTVIPLPAAEEKELKETLQDVIGQGTKVILEQKIDPSILGGIVVEYSQKVFDMSIRTRARQMEQFLREPLNLD